MPEIRYGLLSPEFFPDSIKTRTSFGNLNVPDKFYENLLRSIANEGFRNPVLFSNEKGKLEIIYGESRCWVAHTLKIKVPAFINDYYNTFKDFELITTEKQAREKFKDKPTKFRFGHTIFFFGCTN